MHLVKWYLDRIIKAIKDDNFEKFHGFHERFIKIFENDDDYCPFISKSILIEISLKKNQLMIDKIYESCLKKHDFFPQCIEVCEIDDVWLLVTTTERLFQETKRYCCNDFYHYYTGIIYYRKVEFFEKLIEYEIIQRLRQTAMTGYDGWAPICMVSSMYYRKNILELLKSDRLCNFLF